MNRLVPTVCEAHTFNRIILSVWLYYHALCLLRFFFQDNDWYLPLKFLKKYKYSRSIVTSYFLPLSSLFLPLHAFPIISFHMYFSSSNFFLLHFKSILTFLSLCMLMFLCVYYINIVSFRCSCACSSCSPIKKNKQNTNTHQYKQVNKPNEQTIPTSFKTRH